MSLRLVLIVGLLLIFLTVLALRSASMGMEGRLRKGKVVRSQEIEPHDGCIELASLCSNLPSNVVEALIHYATSNIATQQTLTEISISSRV